MEENKEELKNSTNGNTTIEGSGESVVEKDESEGQSATVVMLQVPNQEESKNIKVEEEKPLQINNNNFQSNSITHSFDDQEIARKRSSTNPKRFLKAIFTQPDLLSDKNKVLEVRTASPEIFKQEKSALESQNHRLSTWRLMLEDIAKQDKKRIEELEVQIAEMTRQKNIFEQTCNELQQQSNKVVEQLQSAISLLNS